MLSAQQTSQLKCNNNVVELLLGRCGCFSFVTNQSIISIFNHLRFEVLIVRSTVKEKPRLFMSHEMMDPDFTACSFTDLQQL